jgi:pimeloyl-ACP methyl ester carboxylesterase
MTVMAAPSDTLAWIERNLAVPAREYRVAVSGARIAYRAWGPRDADGVLLVHGGLAHSGWWDHIAPALEDCRVVAVDLSGNGDSSHRDGYAIEGWADEVAAVARAAGLRNTVLVGHSMGGVVSVAAAGRHPRLFRAVVTVDTRFNDAGWPGRDKPSPVFEDVEEAIARFSLAHGDTDAPIAEILRRHIALGSLREDADGWRWKRADSLWIQNTPLRDLLPHLTAPLAIVHTEGGVLDARSAAEMRALAPVSSADVVIPASGHNPLLDQPIAFVAVLRSLLTAWLPALVPTTSPSLKEND